MKSMTAATLIALSALAGAPLAHAEVDDDPLTHQLNRWGAPQGMQPGAQAQQQQIARYYYERGGYVPPNVLHSPYNYLNWQSLALPQPVPGYQWFQMGNEYVLANQITGLIAQALRFR